VLGIYNTLSGLSANKTASLDRFPSKKDHIYVAENMWKCRV